MNAISVVRTIVRYWRMAHDPRTPPWIRYMIYAGIVATLMPKKILPKGIPGMSLVESGAVLPGIVAVSMMMIPNRVKESEDLKSEKGIERKKIEGMQNRPPNERPSATTENSR